MKPLAVLALVMALSAVWAAGGTDPIDQQAVAGGTFPDALEHLRVVKLLHLDPGATRKERSPGTPRFHKWVVASESVKIDASAGKSLILSLRAIVDARDERMAACFYPRHGAVLTDGTRTFDLVVCFECAGYQVFNSEGTLVSRGSLFSLVESEAPKWYRIFRESGLNVEDPRAHRTRESTGL